MMLLTVADVTLRKFSSGLPGNVELVSLMLVVAAFFAISHCWGNNGHIRVDLLFDRFSHRIQLACSALGVLAGLIFFGAIVWGGIGFAIKAYKNSEVSTNLLIPLYLVKFFLLIGVFVFFLQLLISLIDFLCRTLKGPELR
jgi:TRAP-type C4-dicarboxylate transport system permease small subunit